MGHYYAIHTSVKLKPDTPKEIVDFFDLLYRVNQDSDNDEQLHSALGSLFPDSTILKGELNIDRAICYGSSYHDTYRYRGKIDNLYYSFSSSTENPLDDWLELLKNVFEYLDVKHGDIVYRWVWEDDSTEDLLWVDLENSKITQSTGYKYRTDRECEYVLDDTHPWNQLRHEYPIVHYTNYFDLVNKKHVEGTDRFAFLLG